MKTSFESVIDSVMSSYSSSMKAILPDRSSRGLGGTHGAIPQALLVVVLNTAGSRPLLFVKQEVEMLNELCRAMPFDPVEPGRRNSDVFSHLSQCKIFHFAGHGFTDSSDSSKNCLLLDDGKKDLLTVATLLGMNIREQLPFLAYLSAFRTRQSNNDRLLDKSIHLISAF